MRGQTNLAHILGQDRGEGVPSEVGLEFRPEGRDVSGEIEQSGAPGWR